MSVDLSIEGVPDKIVARLRERAKRNHRSLQEELMAIVVRAAAELEIGLSSEGAATIGPRMDAVTGRQPGGRAATQRGTKSPDQIAADLRRIFPTPLAGLPNSLDIIREARKSR